MTGLNSVLSHSPSVVTRKTGNEYVLVPVANNIADMNSVFVLNETGAFIWEQIDGKRTVGEIIEVVINEYEIDNDSASKDVFDFIENMKSFLIVNLQKL
jgi:methyltransferase-like protein